MKHSLKFRIYNYLTSGSVNNARIFLASSSFVWALMLLEPFNITDSFKLFFLLQNNLDDALAIFFIIYSTASTFIITTKCKNKILNLLESLVGFGLWTLASISVFYTHNAIPSISAPLFVGTVFSWWVLIRSSLRNDR